MCSRSVSKGDRRTWFTCHAHFWLAFEMERSQGTISVSQDRSRDRLRRLTRIFFFKGASGGEENKRGWCVSHSVRNRSFVDLRFHKFVFLSFFRHPPPSSSKTCLRTTRVCESLQLAARESISIRGKGIYSFTNETSCRYEALFQINSSGPLVQPDDNINGYNALCPFLVSDIFMRKRTTRLC